MAYSWEALVLVVCLIGFLAFIFGGSVDMAKAKVQEPRARFVALQRSTASVRRSAAVQRHVVPVQVNATPAQQGRTCIVDAERWPTTDFPVVFHSSDHRHEDDICQQCLTGWLEAEIESKAWDQIQCPQPDCAKRLSYEEVRLALVGNKQLFER